MKFVVYIISLVLIFGKIKRRVNNPNVRDRISDISRRSAHLSDTLPNLNNTFTRIQNKRKAIDVIQNTHHVDMSDIETHLTYKTDKATHKLLAKALYDYKD